MLGPIPSSRTDSDNLLVPGPALKLTQISDGSGSDSFGFVLHWSGFQVQGLTLAQNWAPLVTDPTRANFSHLKNPILWKPCTLYHHILWTVEAISWWAYLKDAQQYPKENISCILPKIPKNNFTHMWRRRKDYQQKFMNFNIKVKRTGGESDLIL